jgi:hypothetical protein
VSSGSLTSYGRKEAPLMAQHKAVEQRHHQIGQLFFFYYYIIPLTAEAADCTE